MNQNKKQKIYLFGVIFGIFILPFLLLFASGGINDIDFGSIIPSVFDQFIGTMSKNMGQFLLIFIPTLFFTIISTTLLFDIKIDDRRKEKLQNSWYWKYFFEHLITTKKHGWHIVLGYFLAIIMLNPVVTDAMLSIQELMQPITRYQGYFLSSIFLIPVLVVARILSKLEIQILDTNIGIFIILVYISEVVFSVFTGEYVPLEQLRDFIELKISTIEGVTMLYGSVLMGCLLCSILDWVIITRIMKKPL